MVTYPSVLITGASSGIGRALALACAAPAATLHLTGRNAARLAATAEACRSLGAAVRSDVLDVRDAAAMADWVRGAGPLALVVANAGISAGTEGGRPEAAAQARAIFGVNLDGMLNTVLPALEVMRLQVPDAVGLRGRIAVVASVAAFVSAPGAPAYCASKAAVDAWTVATAATARQAGVQMTSICPGYIRTAMTERNRFPMPGLMDADRAVRIILRGVAAGRRRVTFPWWMGAAARLIGLLPPRLSATLLSIPPGKAPLPEGG
jgi:NAD(P)-dependent dehydrogenase (short-subunit alcohol dehydrogenase family)